jgi:hypothetical protein
VTVATAIALVDAVANLTSIAAQTYAQLQATSTETELAPLKAKLDALHAQNMALSATLDAAAAEAAKA